MLAFQVDRSLDHLWLAVADFVVGEGRMGSLLHFCLQSASLLITILGLNEAVADQVWIDIFGMPHVNEKRQNFTCFMLEYLCCNFM